jgi:hypothetical protein
LNKRLLVGVELLGESVADAHAREPPLLGCFSAAGDADGAV